MRQPRDHRHEPSPTSHVDEAPARAQPAPRLPDGLRQHYGLPSVDGGLPGPLRAGLESLSGYDLSGVRVHYHSSRPAEVQAHAFAQGHDIHLGPGQEQHLPHEAWHVVQQLQGRAGANRQRGGVALNDDRALEEEADRMGARALTAGPRADGAPLQIATPATTSLQRYVILKREKEDSGYRISQERQILVRQSSRDLYASPDAIARSNEQLLARQSFVRLKAVGGCPHEKYLALQQVMPVWVEGDIGSRHKPARTADTQNKANRKNKDAGPVFYTWADCAKAAQMVMGEKTANDERCTANVGDVRLPPKGTATNLHTPGKLGENFGNAVYINAIPLYLKHLRDNNLIAADHPALAVPAGTDKGKQTRKQYALLSDDLRAHFDQICGINEFANPEVGDAYVTAQETVMGGERGQWIYHWGGVIMSDGDDRVTLEGFSVGLAQVVASDRWTFNIFGTNGSGTSFHETQLDSDHHGDHATTIVISGPNAPKKRD